MTVLEAAQRGDGEAFAQLTGAFRRELHAHCYRMLGTLADADDALQQTLLRAWRALPSYQPAGPEQPGRHDHQIRAWLYRITTNVCLTALRARSRERARTRSIEGTQPLHGQLLLDPYPDRLPGWPESSFGVLEDVELAFLVALQVLPARQRAVLLLRDVLDFEIDQVAEMLQTSVAAVNSALQRARTTCTSHRRSGRISRHHTPAPTRAEAALVSRFTAAWQAADHRELARLLVHDALLTMPPQPMTVTGREAVVAFLLTVPDTDRPGDFQTAQSRANGQPALILHAQDADSVQDRPYAVLVFSLHDGLISSITRFSAPGLVERFSPASAP